MKFSLVLSVFFMVISLIMFALNAIGFAIIYLAFSMTLIFVILLQLIEKFEEKNNE
jgi:hypothetical protein